MAAWNTSMVVAAGVGLMFGLCGGIAGAWIAGAQPPAPAPNAALTSSTPPLADTALRDALTDLTHEVRALHESLTTRMAEPTRSPALASSTLDLERLVAALESFARVASESPPTSGATGRSAAPLILPTRPRDQGRLLELAQTDFETRSRQHRFLTYQQVLDRFGQPDDVYENGLWRYELPDSNSLLFRFFDGMLIRID